MKYTKEDIVIGTVIQIMKNHTITRIIENKIFFGKESLDWDMSKVLERLNSYNWKVISIPQNTINYEIY